MGRSGMRAAVLAALLMATGCATGTPPAASDGADRAVVLRIDAADDANGRRPVAVDVVRAGDAAMARRLDELDAAAWFRARTALRAEGGARIAIASWEMVPGQSVALRGLPPFAATPVATFVYARYATPGPHRQRLDGNPPLAVRLGRDGFAAEPLAGGAAP